MDEALKFVSARLKDFRNLMAPFCLFLNLLVQKARLHRNLLLCVLDGMSVHRGGVSRWHRLALFVLLLQVLLLRVEVRGGERVAFL